MKIGYSTYAMEPVPLVEALTGLAEIGYEALEIAALPGRPEAPEKLSESARKRLKGLLRKVKFPPPVIMTQAHPVIRKDRDVLLKHFAAVCQLGADLNFKKSPAVVTCSPPENTQLEWPLDENEVLTLVTEFADVAKDHGVVLALRPAVDSCVDTPEEIMDFLKRANHPNLKLNFDVAHFAVKGLNPEACLESCRSEMVYGMVKDCVDIDGETEFMLPGDGDFDYPSYMVALNESKYNGIVCVEVSAAIYESEGYEPWDAAEYSFDVLNEAREVAEMGWG